MRPPVRPPARRPVLRALAATVVTVALLGVVVAAPVASSAPASAPTPEQRYAKQAVRASNTAREQHGLRALRVDDCVRSFARKQAKAMARKEQMYHQDLRPVMSTCGLSTVGENVAYGYPTGRAVVWQGWMESPGHRANILSRAYRLVAVAARRSDDGTWYAAQVFGSRS